MRGRHSYMLLSILRVKFRLEPAPEWLLTALLIILAGRGLGSGLDLALDPETSSDIYAYADIVGANTWGWLQALASVLLLLAMASRWLSAILATQVVITAIWFVYGIAIFQGTLPIITEAGGLRNAFNPWATAAVMFIGFLATVDQMRRRIARDGRPA